ncbi:uncharacterized protein [Antedon mediterranea]|uniref:uncharacterized protein n=1 Tax=Antedon mediterranea TaxID=105859 RepID=UPI003AF9A4D2
MQFKEDSEVISQSHAEHVTKLWNNLDAYDKTVKRKARHHDYLTKGRFKKSKTTAVIPGVESTRQYNRTSKKQERQVLESGISATIPKLVSDNTLLEPLTNPAVLNDPASAPSFTFVQPKNTSGGATLGNRLSIPVPGEIANPPPSVPAASSTRIPRTTLLYRKRVAKDIGNRSKCTNQECL